MSVITPQTISSDRSETKVQKETKTGNETTLSVDALLTAIA